MAWHLGYNLTCFITLQRPVGRPRKDDSTLHQVGKSGGLAPARSKSPATGASNVIVVPIQISKEMIAAKQTNAASGSGISRSSPSTSSVLSDKEKLAAALKAKVASSVVKTATESKFKARDIAVKGSPKPTPTRVITIEPKDDDSSPTSLSTRRSRRENKMSSKLAEWGLLPSGELLVFLHFQTLLTLILFCPGSLISFSSAVVILIVNNFRHSAAFFI